MKQFYETYSVGSDFHHLWLNIQRDDGQTSFVPPLATQLQDTDSQHSVFVSTLLTQIQWSFYFNY